jgi:hypothetical protein
LCGAGTLARFVVPVVVQFKTLQLIVIPKRYIMREESAVSTLTGSSFLANEAGLGVTSSAGFRAKRTTSLPRSLWSYPRPQPYNINIKVTFDRPVQ